MLDKFHSVRDRKKKKQITRIVWPKVAVRTVRLENRERLMERWRDYYSLTVNERGGAGLGIIHSPYSTTPVGGFGLADLLCHLRNSRTCLDSYSPCSCAS